jgi:arylsulfatase
MPKGIDGIDLTPWLLGKGPRKSHAYLYWEFPSYGGQQALRMGRWKTVRQKIFKTGLHTELYDLQKDPSESRNVASLYPAVVTEMEKLMSEARRPSKVYPFKNLDVPGQ